jgi:hypothetical protein
MVQFVFKSSTKKKVQKILWRSNVSFLITMSTWYFEMTTWFKMVLDIEVPKTIAEHFPLFIHPFWAKRGLTINDIDHLIFHHQAWKKLFKTEDLFQNLIKY